MWLRPPIPQKPPKAGLRSVLIEWGAQKGRARFKKPAKTREELESAIRLEMEDICECLRVWPSPSRLAKTHGKP